MYETYQPIGMVRQRDNSVTIVYSIHRNGATYEAHFSSDEEMSHWCIEHNCQPPYRTCITIL